MAPLVTVPIVLPTRGEEPRTSWLLSGFDDRLLRTGAPSLADRGAYATDTAAYRAVLADPQLAIVDPLFSQLHLEATGERLAIGRHFQVIDPLSGTTRTLQVAALGRTDLTLNGALVGVGAITSLVGATPAPTRAYLAAGPDARAVARRLMVANAQLGIEADAITDIVGNSAAIENQFFQLARGYLGLGLLVGIAGLAVVMVRAVRDRRREIGVLRSLGFHSRDVGRTLLVEAGFVSVLGAVVGAALAVLTAYNVVTSTDLLGHSISFSVPFLSVVSLAAVTVAISLAATLLPARAAARVRPAAALRISD